MDVPLVLERQRISVMTEITDQLIKIAEEWKADNLSVIPEVDWSKIRELDFQENLRTRNALDMRLEGKISVTCHEFQKHVRTSPF